MAGQKSILDPYEFSADFQRLMNKNIEKLEHERAQQSKRRPIDFCGTLNRSLLFIYGKLCNVDLYGGHQYYGANKTDQTSKSAEKLNWMARLMQVLYIVCTLRTIIRIYFQYLYDFNKLRYNRLLQTPDGGGDDSPRAFTVDASFLSGRQSPLSNNRTLLETYSRRIQAATLGLNRLGAPLREMSFGIQFLELFLVIMASILYFQTQIYLKYIQFIDLSITRSMLDLKKELRACNAVIRREINRFVESSRNFTCTALLVTERRQHAPGHPVCQMYSSYRFDSPLPAGPGCDAAPALACLPDHPNVCGCFERGHRACYQRSRSAAPLPAKRLEQPETSYQLLIRDKLLDHFYIIKSIESLALNGALMPCSRTGTWVSTMAFYNFLTGIFFSLYCLFIGVVLVSIPSLAHVEYHTDFLDLIGLLEIVVLLLIVMITSLFYTSLISTSSLDQLHLLQQLKRNMVAVISTNTLRYQASRRLNELVQHLDQELARGMLEEKTRKTTIDDIRRCSLLIAGQYTQMDADLLNILLQYKIFVAQLKPTKRSYGFVSLLASTLVLLMPLLGCLHVPYMDKRIKVYAGLLSLLCALVADITILGPISYLYTRTAELYKLLSSLLAHTVAVSLQQHLDTIQNDRLSRWRSREQKDDKLQSGQVDDMLLIFDLASTEVHKIYNGHSIWMLRKELNHPDCLVDQFVTFVFGVRLNYSNLLKVHFWLGIVMQTIFFGNAALGTQQEFLESFMLDPLGLF